MDDITALGDATVTARDAAPPHGAVIAMVNVSLLLLHFVVYRK